MRYVLMSDSDADWYEDGMRRAGAITEAQIDDYLTRSKSCTKCNRTLPPTSFYRGNGKLGLSSACKDCRRWTGTPYEPASIVEQRREARIRLMSS